MSYSLPLTEVLLPAMDIFPENTRITWKGENEGTRVCLCCRGKLPNKIDECLLHFHSILPEVVLQLSAASINIKEDLSKFFSSSFIEYLFIRGLE